jgi:ribosomal protein S3
VFFVCRACYGVLRFVMESGAKGCEVIVSGKLRAQRAKSMKFKVRRSSSGITTQQQQHQQHDTAAAAAASFLLGISQQQQQS